VMTAGQLIGGALTAASDGYADKGITLTSDVQPQLPDVRVDPERLAQVLGNLLDNALRHTGPGGAVTVAAAAAHGYVTLQVADTGAGIPHEHLPHVFERFYRVDTARDRNHGGSGIGLAITKALVEAHGGRITATSSGPGAGAVFTVQLPSNQPS
jgi:two-component system sensor histidine kinase BaeS